MPSKAWKKATASSITSPPTTLATVRRNVWAATFTAFTMPRPGAGDHAEQAVVEEAGQPPRARR